MSLSGLPDQRRKAESEDIMKYEIRYAFDGGLWYRVIEAETAEQAIKYLWDYIAYKCDIISVTESDEDPDLVVPAGWKKERPAPLTEEEETLWEMYCNWSWDRCMELELDPEDCDVDFETWLHEVYAGSEV